MNISTYLRRTWVMLFGISLLGINTWAAKAYEDSPSFFPIGLEAVEDPRDFPEIAAAGFNLVHGYRFEGAYEKYPNTNRSARAYLDAAQKAGLRVLMGLELYLDNKTPREKELAHIKERVLALKDHPVLFGWKLYDEPAEQDPPVSSKNLQWAYQTVKQFDPIHPTTISTADEADEKYAPYAAAADILIPDHLPIGLTADSAPPDIAQYIDAPVRVWVPKGKVVIASIQVYNLAKDTLMVGNPPTLEGRVILTHGRYPTYEEIRFMAYYAIMLGSKGVFLNCYRYTYDAFEGDKGDDVSRKNNPSQWARISRVSSELKSLIPILSAPTQDRKKAGVEIEDDTSIDMMVKQHQGKTYLVTVNWSPDPVEVEIGLASDRFPNPHIAFLPGGRRISFDRGSFNDRWSGYDVRIYEIAVRRP